MSTNYRSILVPLDGSELAENALLVATSIARRHAAALHIVRVYVPIAGVEGEHAVRYDEPLDRELMRRAQQYLDDIGARLERDGGIRASAALKEGYVADTIGQHAAAVGADLLVMTTHGRGPLSRFWFGSVSDELARESGIPILFVRQAPAADVAAEHPLRRVLIPLDGSAVGELVLEPVTALWGPEHTEYTLLQVVEPEAELDYGPAGGSVTGFQESLDELREREQAELSRIGAYLETVAARLRARSFTVHTRVVASHRPASAILEDASVHGADVIALATRCRKGLRRLVLGSVADKVLRGADASVFTYRPA